MQQVDEMAIDRAAGVQKKGAELLGTLWQQWGWSVAAADEVVVTNFTTIEEHNKNDLCCVLM